VARHGYSDANAGMGVKRIRNRVDNDDPGESETEESWGQGSGSPDLKKQNKKLSEHLSPSTGAARRHLR
jgi:hypothetical protein